MNTLTLTPVNPKAKWRTIPEFPGYVVSDEGKIAHKEGWLLVVSNNGLVVFKDADGKRVYRSPVKIHAAVWGGGL